MSDTTYDEMLNELDEEENLWAPENNGDQVHGEITDIDYPSMKHGIVPRIWVKDPETKNITIVMAGRAALKSTLAQKKVQPGDLVAIRYLGKKQGNGGNAYHAYKVVARTNGPRDPELMFKDIKGEDDDLGLTPEAKEASDAVWQSDEPAF